MLIKIDNSRYVNTDHICTIALQTKDRALVTFVNGDSQALSDRAARYIIMFMDPNEGLFEDPTPEETYIPIQLSLSSRIAIFLKNHPVGVQLSTILTNFADDDNEIALAINELLRERVIDTNQILYWHKANPQPESNPTTEASPDRW